MTWSLYAIVYDFRGMNWGVFIACGWLLVSLMDEEIRYDEENE